MWSTMPTPLRAPASATRRMSSTRPSSSPSRLDGRPSRKPIDEVLGAVRRPRRRRDELEDVLRRRPVEVLDHAALAGAPPEVVVDGVGALGGRGHRDAVLLRVGDLLVAAHLPLAHRRDHLELRRQGGDRRLDPHLVVALARAAVGDRVGAVLAGDLARELGEQRPAEAGEERVAALVAGVGADRGGHVVARELLLGVHHQALDGARGRGPSAGRRRSRRRAGRGRCRGRSPRRRTRPGST